MKTPFSINDMFIMLDNTNTEKELVYRIQDIALNLSDIAYKKGYRLNIDKLNIVDSKIALPLYKSYHLLFTPDKSNPHSIYSI